MPKEVYLISDFSGGINNAMAPRDLEDNESTSIVDFRTDSLGKLKTRGSMDKPVISTSGVLVRAWDDGSSEKLTAAVTDTTGTTFTIQHFNSFGIGDVLLIDSEQVYVTATTDDTNDTITVIRGYNGTTAATHLINTTIKRLNVFSGEKRIYATTSGVELSTSATTDKFYLEEGKTCYPGYLKLGRPGSGFFRFSSDFNNLHKLKGFGFWHYYYKMESENYQWPWWLNKGQEYHNQYLSHVADENLSILDAHGAIASNVKTNMSLNGDTAKHDASSLPAERSYYIFGSTRCLHDYESVQNYKIDTNASEHSWKVVDNCQVRIAERVLTSSPSSTEQVDWDNGKVRNKINESSGLSSSSTKKAYNGFKRLYHDFPQISKDPENLTYDIDISDSQRDKLDFSFYYSKGLLRMGLHSLNDESWRYGSIYTIGYTERDSNFPSLISGSTAPAGIASYGQSSLAEKGLWHCNVTDLNNPFQHIGARDTQTLTGVDYSLSTKRSAAITTNLANDSYMHSGPFSETLHVHVADSIGSSSDGTWDWGEGVDSFENRWQMYHSYVFDSNVGDLKQEGRLVEVMPVAPAILKGTQKVTQFTWKMAHPVTDTTTGHTFLAIGGQYLDHRVTGSRWYIKWDIGSNDDPGLLFEIDYKKGGRVALTSEWISFENIPVNTSVSLDSYGSNLGRAVGDAAQPFYTIFVSFPVMSDPPLGSETFESLNYYKPSYRISENVTYGAPNETTWSPTGDVHSVASFKDAVSVNNVVYAGNVDGKRDFIRASDVHKPDIFLQERVFALGLDDGDEITALKVVGNRVFQFKRNTLQLANIVEEGALQGEGSYSGKGVVHKSHVADTDYGIAWANKHGLFYFDGEKVVNLTETEKGTRIANWESDWNSDYGLVGFDRNTRQIIVMFNADEASSGDGYVYSLSTNSFYKVNSMFQDGYKFSNFINSENGSLMTYSDKGGSPNVFEYSDTSVNTTASAEWISKDYDLGTPSLVKKLYNFKISYKNSGSSNLARIGYRLNGSEGSFTYTDSSESAMTFNDSTGLLVNKEFKINTNAYSIQFIVNDVDGGINSSFELHDISIIYRQKVVK